MWRAHYASLAVRCPVWERWAASCTIQLLSCASNPVPRGLVQPGGTWQLQSAWELPRFKMKAPVFETMVWKQHYASGPGQLSAVHAFGEAVKERGITPFAPSNLLKQNWSNQWLRESYRVFHLLVTKRERKLTFWQCPWSFTVLSSSYSLPFSLPWPVSACANSVFCPMLSVCKVL